VRDGFASPTTPERMRFNPDGTMTVWTAQANTYLDFAFRLAPERDFVGDVFVQIVPTGPIQASLPKNNERVQIASVREHNSVTAQTTNVEVGFSTVLIQEIVISESFRGAFTSGSHTLIFTLDQPLFGGQFSFVNIPFNVMANHVDVVGGPSGTSAVIPQRNINTPANEFSLTLTVGAGATGDPIAVTLSNIRVNVAGNVPEGPYGFTITQPRATDTTGVSVTTGLLTNLDYMVRNVDVDAGGINTMVSRATATYVNYAQPTIRVENAIVVGEAQKVVETTTTTVEIMWADGMNSFIVDGQVRNFRTEGGALLTSRNVDNRTYVPMRSVIEALGGVIFWIPGGGPGGANQIATEIPGALRPEVLWTVGSTVVTIPGALPRSVSVAPLFDNGTNYLPFRSIAEAHGFDLDDGVSAGRQSAIITFTR
jgi:hypothetical protein